MKNTWKRWIVCFLALAMVIAGAGCGSGANNGPGGNDPEEKTYQAEPPEVYGFAMEVRVRARFMLYLNDRGGLIKHDVLNEAAKEIDAHINWDGDAYDVVMDIFQVAFDDLKIDPEKDDLFIDLVETNLSAAETGEILNRALDAAEEVLRRMGVNAEVHSALPEDMPEDPEPDHPGDEPGPDNPGPDEPGPQFPTLDHADFDTERGEWTCEDQEGLNSVIAYFRGEEEKDGMGNHGPIHVVLANDLALSLGSEDYKDVSVDCDRHAVTLSGVAGVSSSSESGAPLSIDNASSVDLSGLTVDMASAKNLPPSTTRYEDGKEVDLYWDLQREYVTVLRVAGTPADAIALPSSIPNRESIREEDYSIFDPIICYEQRSDGVEIVVLGPQDTYENRQNKEQQMLNALFANGEYQTLIGSRFYAVYTDITLNIGDVSLPDMNYDHILIEKGGHLTLTGTLRITGGTLDVDLRDPNGLDIRNLTLVKAHPSPDMIHIHASNGVNEELCHCRTASGTIYFSVGPDGMSITIW